MVAAVPADEWSVLAVFELDDVASHPASGVALDGHLEDDLRTAVSDLDRDVFVKLGSRGRPEGVAADEGDGVEAIGAVSKDEVVVSTREGDELIGASEATVALL